MYSIAIVFGTRPQVIKLAPLVKELDKHPKKIAYQLINTGQHYTAAMHADLMQELQLPEVSTNFKINPSWSPLERLSSMLLGLNVVFSQLPKVDLVVVIGDTDSTLAGALAASKNQIPIMHIEAFVRSGDRTQPEEINRILVDEMATYHIRPDRNSQSPYEKGHLHSCDLQLDAFMMFREKAKEVPVAGPFNLLTLHRASLTPSFIQEVFSVLTELPDRTIWPVHPRIEPWLAEMKIPDTVLPIPPVGYLEMIWLLTHCRNVFTDSGGLYREAQWAGKYCVNLRTHSEWVSATLREYTAESILEAYHATHLNLHRVSPMFWIDQHGRGEAASKIVQFILDLSKES